jgi:CHAT domain
MTNTILFMSADPTDTARLRLGQGMRDVRERLLLSKSASNYVFLCRTSMRPGDITQTLFETEPQFVHFSGHGTESGALCFENDQGETHAVTLDALGELFSLFSTTIKCVVLNACFSVHQARAIVRNIPFVVGMKKEIGDAAAIAFAVGFYKALGAGRDVPEAYRFGLVELKLLNIPEHATPVLLERDSGLTEFIKKDQAGARDFATTHASIRIMRPRKEAFLQQRQEEWLIRTGSYLTLQDALDKIYAHIVADEGLPPHSYGSEWILVNQFASKFSFWRHVIAPFNWVEAGNRRSCHDIAPGWSLQPPSVTGLLPDTEWEITFDPAKIDAFAVLTNSDVLPNVFERNPKIHAALLDSDYLRRCKAADVVATHFKHILVFEEWADFGKKGAVFVDGKKTFVDDASILRKYHLR